MEISQNQLLAIVETWRLSEQPEFRGFRCANCQRYFIGKAWHYLLQEGGYSTPVHFCEECQTDLANQKPSEKPKISIDRIKFKPAFNAEAMARLDTISENWDLNATPTFKDFTCDSCMQPLETVDSRPQGWHVWRNKDGILIEYHFDKTCGDNLLK